MISSVVHLLRILWEPTNINFNLQVKICSDINAVMNLICKVYFVYQTVFQSDMAWTRIAICRNCRVLFNSSIIDNIRFFIICYMQLVAQLVQYRANTVSILGFVQVDIQRNLDFGFDSDS